MRSWDCLCRLVSPRIARYARYLCQSAQPPGCCYDRILIVVCRPRQNSEHLEMAGTVVSIANVVDTKILQEFDERFWRSASF